MRFIIATGLMNMIMNPGYITVPMNKQEEEIIGANPICLKCQMEIADRPFSSLMTRKGFVVFHDKCFLKAVDKFSAQQGVQEPARETVN